MRICALRWIFCIKAGAHHRVWHPVSPAIFFRHTGYFHVCQPRLKTPMTSIGVWIILSFLGLLPDVFFNGFFGNSGTYAPYEISGYPDLSTPILFFEPRKLFKQELGRYAFQDLRYSGRSNPRGRARWEMYMVWPAIYLSEFYIVMARNGSEYLLHAFLRVGIDPNSLTIFCWPGEVVP